MPNENYRMSAGDFAKLVGRTVSTVQRWDRDGVLTAYRTAGGRRYYTIEHYLQIKGPITAGRGDIGYCRVLNESDSKGHDRQRSLINSYCADHRIIISNWIHDVGNGFTLARTQTSKLFDMIEIGLVRSLVLTHRDRILMIGYESFEEFCKKHSVDIIVVADSLGDQFKDHVNFEEEFNSFLSMMPRAQSYLLFKKE